MPRQPYYQPNRQPSCCLRGGFTLIELVVVMLLLVMLAAVGLPTLKNGIKDQKSSQAARQVQAYFELARSRAMATGRSVGVIIDRFGADDAFDRSYSIQMRMTNSVPPYAGESDTSLAYLFHDSTVPAATTTIANAALFDPLDNPLLALSAKHAGGAAAPIKIGDRLEFAGGRTVSIRGISFHTTPPPAGYTPPPLPLFPVKIVFDPREEIPNRTNPPISFTDPKTFGFPASLVPMTATQPLKFRIHRLPVPSAASPLSMVRGQVIDLNYSGIGPDGTQFSPQTIAGPAALTTGTADFHPIVIMFAPDGSVEYVSWGNLVSSGMISTRERPAGNIYLCLGNSDGVRPDDLMATTEREVANLMNPETMWMVINPFNGNVYTSPAATVTSPLMAAAPMSVTAAVLKSRQYAITADTLSSI